MHMDGKPGIEVANELIGLCRAGRLYDVEKWIEAGRSLDISMKTKRGRARNLFGVALETGFHSMVELIVKQEGNQSVKDEALYHAVSMKRQDLVELLVQYGADPKAVSFADVLLTWEPELIRFCRSRRGRSDRPTICGGVSGEGTNFPACIP